MAYRSRLQLYIKLIIICAGLSGCARQASQANLSSPPPSSVLRPVVQTANQQNVPSQPTSLTPEQQFMQAQNDCLSGKLTRKNAISRDQCWGAAYAKYMAYYPHQDLINSYLSNNRIAAVDYAEGKISLKKYIALSENYKALLAQQMEQAKEADYKAQQEYQIQQQLLALQQKEEYQAQQQVEQARQQLADAQQAQAWQSISSALAQYGQQQQQAPQMQYMPWPTTTNCRSAGSGFNCTTH